MGFELGSIGDIPAGPHLLAVKHQSMFETLEIVRLSELPVIVLKKELADMPLFGFMTRRYGVIPVERSAGAKALREMVAAGKRAVATGRPIIIYPEGTRVRPGETPPLRRASPVSIARSGCPSFRSRWTAGDCGAAG